MQPLYHQPSDTRNYDSNKRIFYGGLKARLIQHLKRDATDRLSRIDKLTNTYSKLRTEWLRKVMTLGSHDMSKLILVRTLHLLFLIHRVVSDCCIETA